MTYAPQGFLGWTARLGLKDAGDDFVVVMSDRPTTSAAVFTRSRFAGPSVLLSQQAATASLRGIVALSRNANVATGAQGLANAREVRATVAGLVDVPENEILLASTGVIGVQYPMQTMMVGLRRLPAPLSPVDLDAAAKAIMTTDTFPKVQRRGCGKAKIVGIAKGVGMIEPNMATLLTFFFTDAEVSAKDLRAIFTRVVERTFNALSIDTDTSTSDTASVIANGAAGPVDLVELEAQLYDCALALTRSMAHDGEGASKLIEVRVSGARDAVQAKRVGKTVVNSPLVKTAVHGADPNWGRVTMAIGKCEDDLDIIPEKVRIAFGDVEVYPAEAGEGSLAALRDYMAGTEVIIEIDLGIGLEAFSVYGCDLTEGYIRLNADYTT